MSPVIDTDMMQGYVCLNHIRTTPYGLNKCFYILISRIHPNMQRYNVVMETIHCGVKVYFDVDIVANKW